MNNSIYFNVLEALKKAFPQQGLGYRNMVVATIIAKGKKDKINENWIKNALLNDVLDGFLTYDQAVSVNKEYFRIIEQIKANY